MSILSRTPIVPVGLALLGVIVVLIMIFQSKWEAIPTTVFSTLTAVFSFWAYEFSKERFRLDLFEKRWPIYEAILKFCSHVIQQGRLKLDANSQEGTLAAIQAAEESFRGIGWHKSKALFGRDVIQLLEKLNKSYAYLSSFHSAPEDPSERTKWADESNRQLLFIWETVNELPEKFRPYVYFGDYRSNNEHAE